MIKKLYTIMICLLPYALMAQDKGIHFEQDLSWTQVMAKAKAEKKYIFVDCYATWCGPCKAMDQSIYPLEIVGKYMNERFISVRVQMDTSKNDDEEMKKRYADAHNLLRENKVNAFPTYLFYSPDGRAVHKDMGAKQSNDFIAMATHALDPSKQYLTLLENYNQGKRDYSVMPYLAKTAKDFNEKELSLKIASDYMHNYLEKFDDLAFCSKDNLNFINTYAGMLTSNDRVFKLYYDNGAKCDSITGFQGQAKSVVDYIITKEEINPFILKSKNDNPDLPWKKIAQTIKLKYSNEYAARTIINAKPGFYAGKKDWKSYTKSIVEQIDYKGLKGYPSNTGTVFILNNAAWTIFLHSENKKEMKKAISWMDYIMPIDTTAKFVANGLDTKACVLYKMGKCNEAINLEEKAALLRPANNKGILDKIAKMKKREPIWLTEQ